MQLKLENILYRTGVMRTYRGYEYLVQAVIMVSESPSRLQNIMAEVYSPIAEIHGTNVHCVNRDIRIVRDMIYHNGGLLLLCEMTGCRWWKAQKPYPRELIEMLAYYVTHN